jgi:hypothetical protein
MKTISNKYLQIQFGDNKPEMVVAGLCLVHGEDYIFFGVGWDETSLKPYHEIGKLVKEEKGKWTFKQANGMVMIITDLKETDEMYEEALRWLDWTKEWPNMKERVMIDLINSYEDIPKDKMEIVWVMENKNERKS